MHYRLSRLLLAFVLFVGLILSLSASATRTTSLSALQGSNIQPDGHGIATAHRVSTATIPQMRVRGHESANQQDGSNDSDAIATPATVPATLNVVHVPPASSSDPTANEGIPDNGTSPTDANGAGGTDNYIETVNRQFAIFDRSGNLQYTTTYQQWFANVEGNATTFYDPNVIWDAAGKRFIFLVTTGISLLLSVAQQSNANSGDFCNYSFPTLTGLGSDFEKLGVNSVGVFFTANEVAGGKLYNNMLFFVNRAQLESCTQNVSYTTWTKLKNPNGTVAEAVTPAVQITASQGNEYFVNSYPNGGCMFIVWTLDTSNLMLTSTTVHSQCYSPATNAPQAGSSATIYTGDCSITHVSFVNGLLTFAIPASYDFGDGNGPVAIVEWFVLNPVTAKMAVQGAFGTPGYWLFYPSAIRNFQNQMMFVFDVSGPNIDPSIWYVNQTFTGTQALAQGPGPFGQGGIQPWGDYHSAWLDSGGSNPNAVWITGMYAINTSTWGTKFGLVTP